MTQYILYYEHGDCNMGDHDWGLISAFDTQEKAKEALYYLQNLYQQENWSQINKLFINGAPHCWSDDFGIIELPSDMPITFIR